ncbi:MAG: TlpA family protein disulfide reductase [Pirellula sp.]|jgi:thiol-disulfide isomerase/thioredoxin
MDQKTIRLQSRLFLEPIVIDRSEIRSLRFVKPLKSDRESGNVILSMTNGNKLRGTITQDNKDSPFLEFMDDVIGKLQVPKKFIQQNSSSSTALYEWNGSTEPWVSPNSDPLSWVVDDLGCFASKASNQSALLPLAIKGSFAIEATLHSPWRPDFVLSFGKDPEESIRVETIEKSLIIGTSTDFEVVEDLPSKGWTYTFRLEWNDEKRELSILQMSEKKPDETAIVTKSTRSENVEGIFLTNRGSSLRLEKLRLFNTLTRENEETQVANVPSNAKSDQQLAADDSSWCTLRFANNTVITGNVLSFREGFFTIENEFIQNAAIHFTSQQLVKLDQPIAPANVSRPHKLRLGTNAILGECTIRGGMNPILWKCVGQDLPVPLSTDLPATIQYDLNPKQRPSGSQFPDIVYATNGDNLPASLLKMREQQIEIDLPFISGCRIGTSHLQAIELACKGKRLEHGFTKESREQLLSFPRGTELSLYPHALVGKNDDLLRGMIMSISPTAIEMDVKLEPCLIGRDAVNAIVFLPIASLDSKSNENERKVKDNEEDSITLSLTNGFRISANILNVEDTTLKCRSSWLGDFDISTEWISALSFGSVTVSESSLYANWEVKTLRDPAWLETPKNEQAKSLLGTVVEPFSLSTLQGETWNLQDHAGKVIILDFWATWCGPCVKSLPEYLSVASKYNTNDVVFLGVNATETPEVVREFVSRQKLDAFDTLFDFDGELTRKMQVNGIPHTVVIGPTGTIEHVHVGYSKNASKELDTKINNFLRK